MRRNGFIQCFLSMSFMLLFALFIAFFFLGCTTDKPPVPEQKQRDSNTTEPQNHQKSKLLGSSQLDHSGFTSRFSGKSSHDKYPLETKIEKMDVGGKVTINEYSVESTKTEDGKERMTFLRSGKKIRSDCSDIGFFSVLTSPPPGTDINGDGIPDVIVSYFSGGAHCCFEYTVFSLGRELKSLGVLNGEHSEFDFKDLDNDGKYEAIGRDWAFAYWGSSFAGSPAPKVILRWKNGRYRLADDLMRKKYNRDDILRMAKDFSDEILPVSEDDKSLRVDPKVWAAMLELIYTGNGNLAWEFIDRAWPAQEDDSLGKRWNLYKKQFLAEFKTELRKSIYWSDLKIFNGWQ